MNLLCVLFIIHFDDFIRYRIIFECNLMYDGHPSLIFVAGVDLQMHSTEGYFDTSFVNTCHDLLNAAIILLVQKNAEHEVQLWPEHCLNGFLGNYKQILPVLLYHFTHIQVLIPLSLELLAVHTLQNVKSREVNCPLSFNHRIAVFAANGLFQLNLDIVLAEIT